MLLTDIPEKTLREIFNQENDCLDVSDGCTACDVDFRMVQRILKRLSAIIAPSMTDMMEQFPPEKIDEIIEATKHRPAQEVLARIWLAYLQNNLDECRPEWEHGEEGDLRTTLFSGRGGFELITLQDCKNAYNMMGMRSKA